ncbi:hypothetical protein HMPREF1624_06117 [Sporothrix schenckii ATCC 58251]|uniref:Zn(2)-C6 fungal-type domain-containing protein n=1 Tax=Sporothrix schenckii (strain ATCC 58251 / de Perez 2211183) TaxID=1391915 RepID=U7PU01_SPOS1|nr:hypothetical protein HMPREF1624_06117 [Sporothrix schenckii ATCC 58251]
MPRPKKPDGREPKSRSRSGCWSCKARKVKCTEERPSCSKCLKGGYQCDYGIRLNWDGRRTKRPQLKAVHLDAGSLMDGDDDFDDPTSGDERAPPPPPLPQSQLETQFQLGPTAAPPASALPANGAQPTLSVGSFQATGPAQGGPGAPARPSRPSTSKGSAAGQFQILTNMAISPTSPAVSQFAARRPVKPLKSVASKGGQEALAPPHQSPDGARMLLPVAPQPTSQPLSAPDAPESASPADSGDARPRHSKRQRIDSDASERDFAWTWPLSPSTGSGSLSAPSPRQFAPPRGFTPKPTVDGSSPRAHEDGQQGKTSPHSNNSLLHLQATSDFRRLSVNSLLSGPLGPNSAAGTPPASTTSPIPNPPAPPAETARLEDSKRDPQHNDNHHHYRSSCYYGIDAGFLDLDLGKNDDANALSGVRSGPKSSKTNATERQHKPGHESGGYYSTPVSVRIPRALGTLPPKLTENPMNMLYFHHFINNTARVLVPHDDPQSNPFRTILPQMAINNDNLLSLLLAYSASHRARILEQTEPVMRIALWVQDIFPALRQALDDHKQKISNANVATAIMLASLAIVSPTAFGYNIPWQRHLMLARELIATRPEGLRVDHHSSLEGQVCSFLWSWFAYIDVLGGLSGGPTDATPAWILDYKVYDPQDDDEIDCIMGFTTRCIYVLSQIAELVRRHEPDRLRITRKDANAWVPSTQIKMSVESLEVDVRDSMVQRPRPCAHLHQSGDAVRWDRDEMTATNEAYHWAALVQLQRRVLGKPTDHPDVQRPVQQIIDCIDRVSFGGTAENCLLFPLFTAGCECLDDGTRKNLLNRMLSVEGTGMMQVTRARALMQKAWGTGKPWETLLTTEFIG